MKTKIIIIIVLLLVIFFKFPIKYASAADGLPGEGDKCPDNFILDDSGVCFPTGTGLAGEDDDRTIKDILISFMYWILGILGVLALLAFIISGVQYLVSAGDEKIIETAKRNIKWSIVGLTIALASLAIVKAIDFIFTSGPPAF